MSNVADIINTIEIGLALVGNEILSPSSNNVQRILVGETQGWS